MPAELSGVCAVLLSGGGGTRLWPISTEFRPKQFIPLFHGKSLFQLTLERTSACGIHDIFVVTNEIYADTVLEQSTRCGIPVSLLLEPARRDSGPAIAAAAAHLKAHIGNDVCALVMPCDHLIPDHQAFSAAIGDAIAAARSGALVTFGITATSPATEYGYIRRGAPIASAPMAFQAAAFREKPDLETAIRYLASGEYFWNSGIFAFRIGDFAREAERLMPEIWHSCWAAVASAERTEHGLRLNPAAFEQCPQISIDYALFEKADNVAVLPRAFAWSDVGNWASLHATLPHDQNGNAINGSGELHDSRNSLVYADNIRVIAAGLEDMLVVASGDGVLVVPRKRAAELKTWLAAHPQKNEPR